MWTKEKKDDQMEKERKKLYETRKMEIRLNFLPPPVYETVIVHRKKSHSNSKN